ncbi:MAG: hypothetical protein WC875_05625 [Candidatus Absconditabacterales bacterium]
MQYKTIQNNILSRYKQHGRILPRRKTKDPYAIHISEVMLQQTQVERVIPYFHQRMKDFPDYKTLAEASKTDLLRHWSGLGFNSRALRLQDCARKIITNDEGRMTNDRAELMSLPGIGPYTSAAIMAFARNKEVPVIDTNIRRVLIFLFKLDEKISMKDLEIFASKIIPKGKSRDRHNALMDYGALELTARKTKIKPISKQSKFEGSDREVRGALLKKLVQNSEPSDFAEDTCRVQSFMEDFPHKNVKKIVNDMQKEGLIKVKKGILTIAE